MTPYSLNNLDIALPILLCSFMMSLVLTGLLRNILRRRAVLDIPNERSSHSLAVPRGGGLAIVAILIPGLALGVHFLDVDYRHVPLIIGTLILAGISWADDLINVSARSRLSLHLLAACIGSFCFAPNEMLFSGHLPFWLDRTLMVLGWAWFINLYNFMDGIDGLTGVQTISLATGLCVTLAAAGLNNPFLSYLTLVLTGVSLGFLAHNWHPAKIFLGDIGSIPLGYIVGFGLITLAVQGFLGAALILPLYYLADSGITLAKRTLRREKIWQAHRQHFYQRAAKGDGRHDLTVLSIAAANTALIAAAMVSLERPWSGLAASFVIVAVLLGKLHKMATPTSGKQ